MAPKVLVVDDQETVRTVIAALLEAAGYVVETAVDGADGLDKLQGGSFDVVVTDQSMPNMSGLALARACKMRGYHVPVVLATGAEAMPAAQELDDCGIRQALAKPFTADALLQAVESARRR